MVELCRHREIPLLVTQSLRTWKQQDELYAKGRTSPPLGKRHIVTNAKGGQSYHNFGLAFDVVVLDDHEKPIWDADHPSWQLVGEIWLGNPLDWHGVVTGRVSRTWRTLNTPATCL
jgi:peptidoglycan L-alanyl-D-glutamate endopeptidase CwlK